MEDVLSDMMSCMHQEMLMLVETPTEQGIDDPPFDQQNSVDRSLQRTQREPSTADPLPQHNSFGHSRVTPTKQNTDDPKTKQSSLGHNQEMPENIQGNICGEKHGKEKQDNRTAETSLDAEESVSHEPEGIGNMQGSVERNKQENWTITNPPDRNNNKVTVPHVNVSNKCANHTSQGSSDMMQPPAKELSCTRVEQTAQQPSALLENSPHSHPETVGNLSQNFPETVGNSSQRPSKAVENSFQHPSEAVANSSQTPSEPVENSSQHPSEAVENSIPNTSEAVANQSIHFSQTKDKSSEKVFLPIVDVQNAITVNHLSADPLVAADNSDVMPFCDEHVVEHSMKVSPLAEKQSSGDEHATHKCVSSTESQSSCSHSHCMNPCIIAKKQRPSLTTIPEGSITSSTETKCDPVSKNENTLSNNEKELNTADKMPNNMDKSSDEVSSDKDTVSKYVDKSSNSEALVLTSGNDELTFVDKVSDLEAEVSANAAKVSEEVNNMSQNVEYGLSNVDGLAKIDNTVQGKGETVQNNVERVPSKVETVQSFVEKVQSKLENVQSKTPTVKSKMSSMSNAEDAVSKSTNIASSSTEVVRIGDMAYTLTDAIEMTDALTKSIQQDMLALPTDCLDGPDATCLTRKPDKVSGSAIDRPLDITLDRVLDRSLDKTVKRSLDRTLDKTVERSFDSTHSKTAFKTPDRTHDPDSADDSTGKSLPVLPKSVSEASAMDAKGLHESLNVSEGSYEALNQVGCSKTATKIDYEAQEESHYETTERIRSNEFSMGLETAKLEAVLDSDRATDHANNIITEQTDTSDVKERLNDNDTRGKKQEDIAERTVAHDTIERLTDAHPIFIIADHDTTNRLTDNETAIRLENDETTSKLHDNDTTEDRMNDNEGETKAHGEPVAELGEDDSLTAPKLPPRKPKTRRIGICHGRPKLVVHGPSGGPMHLSGHHITTETSSKQLSHTPSSSGSLLQLPQNLPYGTGLFQDHLLSTSNAPQLFQRRSTSNAPQLFQRRSTSNAPQLFQRRSTSNAPQLFQRRSTSNAPQLFQRRSTSNAPQLVQRRSTSNAPQLFQRRSTSNAPPQQHLQRRLTITAPPQLFQRKSTTTSPTSPPQQRCHRRYTTIAPPQQQFQRKSTTTSPTSPPQQHFHRRSTTTAPPPQLFQRRSTSHAPNLDVHKPQEEWTDQRTVAINGALEWIKLELEDMRTEDQELAKILFNLHRGIREVKIQRCCEKNREALDNALDSYTDPARTLTDCVPEALCPVLKEIGITKMNIKGRRFSVL